MKNLCYIYETEKENSVFYIALESKVFVKIKAINVREVTGSVFKSSNLLILDIDSSHFFDQFLGHKRDAGYTTAPIVQLISSKSTFPSSEGIIQFEEENGADHFLIFLQSDFKIDIKECDYVAIRPYCFLQFNESSCDIYIELSPSKHVKIINRDEMYSNEAIEKYQKRNIEFLYVKNEDFASFLENTSKTLLLAYESKSINPNLRNEIDLASHELIGELVRSIGVSELTIELAKKSIDSTLKVISKKPEILAILENIKNKNSYLVEHGTMVSYIACGIASNVEWSSRGTHTKLCMASMLHDISLKSDIFFETNSFSDEFLSNLSTLEKNEYTSHPIKSAEISRGFSEILHNVDSIILEHHENIDGNGFPRGLGHLHIQPLTCIFIIAESFVNSMYEHGFTVENRNTTIENISEKYGKGNFRKPLRGLIDLFLKSRKD